mmetsp:Transcript_10329/g.34195  ORF Transcript_10329/g.34195 Transcript_10329/m.34195 type:complete len:216 (-) Transcript_10329:1187-1834(-)
MASSASSSKKKRSHWKATSTSKSAPRSFCSFAVSRPPLKACVRIFDSISSGESVRKMAELPSEEDILPIAPCKGGKNLEWNSAGLPPSGCPFGVSLWATSRVTRKYGSWSMAHGIRHAICATSPHLDKGVLNDDAKDGAAWMAGNALWPMLDDPSNPNAPRAVLYVTLFQILTTFGYSSPMYATSEKMNVRSKSKPTAMMSFAFCTVSAWKRSRS